MFFQCFLFRFALRDAAGEARTLHNPETVLAGIDQNLTLLVHSFSVSGLEPRLSHSLGVKSRYGTRRQSEALSSSGRPGTACCFGSCVTNWNSPAANMDAVRASAELALCSSTERRCGRALPVRPALLEKQITTIEGVAQNGRLHPVQEAFMQADAMQCGYCTPGMIVSGVALLKKTPHPSEAEIRRAMEGNVLPLRNLSAYRRGGSTG